MSVLFLLWFASRSRGRRSGKCNVQSNPPNINVAPWSCLSSVCSVCCDHPILNPGIVRAGPRRTIAGLTTLKFVDTFLLVHFILVTASVPPFRFFGFGYCMFNFVGEIAEIEKVSPLQSFKFAIFLVILVIFISHWENSKPPLQNKCRFRSYLKRLCSCPWSHIAERGHWRPISIFRQVSLSALTAKWSLMSVLWRILLGGSKRYW